MIAKRIPKARCASSEVGTVTDLLYGRLKILAWLPEELDDIIGRIVFERITAKTIRRPRPEAGARVGQASLPSTMKTHRRNPLYAATSGPFRKVCAALCIVGPKNRFSPRRLRNFTGCWTWRKNCRSTGVRSGTG